MSTILEALKKSEQERKLNDVPRLSDMPVPEESKRWPLYVIAILSLVLALTIGVLISRWLIEPSSPANTSAAQPVFQVEAANKPVAEQVNDLDVNVVSYSDNVSQRFVMLNGKMYRENDFVRAGLMVVEIKPNAVVLNMRGELITRTP